MKEWKNLRRKQTSKSKLWLTRLSYQLSKL